MQRLRVIAGASVLLFASSLHGQGLCLNYTGFVYSGGLDLWGITAGQLNDDTLLDMAVSNHLAADLSIFFGNGDGTFQPVVTLPDDPAPVDIVAGDLKGDERDDLIIAHNGHVLVRLNIGGGSFAAPVSHPFPMTNTYVMDARDIDDDGLIDLLLPHSTGPGLAVLRGNGDGTFQPAVSYATDVEPVSIDFADLNEDGHTDVLYTHLSGFGEVIHFWSVLWGTRPGTFGTRTHVTHPHTSVFASAIDVDHDGHVDAVISDSWPDSLSFRMGDGTGSFGPRVAFFGGIQSSLVRYLDMDLDGNEDLVIADYAGNGVNVFPGNGSGAYGAPVNATAAVDPIDFVVGRFNGDAYPDIMISSSEGAWVGVVLNCTVATGVEEPSSAGALVLAPNPVDDVLTITLGDHTIQWIETHDAAGRLVLRPAPAMGRTVLNTAMLAPGLYAVSAYDAARRSIARERFMKR